MGVNSNQYLQGINQTTGTGAPVHSAVAGDRYTDTATGTTYQYTTSWQTVSYSAGGLTYFTEAQNTASPNATVNVDSLTAIASTTNADLVIKPKGTGSILANIPDDTTTGGTKRGIGVVDLQMKRNNATNVATANYSVIAGGQSNQITAGDNNSIGGGYGNIITTGSYGTIVGGYGNTCVGGSTIGGESNTTTGNYHALFGQNNTSSGGGNFAVGISHILSGFYSGVTGRQNTISAYDTFTAGYLNTNNGQGSAVFGARGSANSTMTKLVIATKGFVAGGSQASRFVSGARTTSATPTILVAFFEDDPTSQSYNQLTLRPYNSIRFKGTIIARARDTNDTSAWDIDGIIQRGLGVGTTTLLIPNINVVQNTPAWGTPTLAANTTLGCLTVTVIGAAANIQWTCSIDTTEVIYAALP